MPVQVYKEDECPTSDRTKFTHLLHIEFNLPDQCLHAIKLLLWPEIAREANFNVFTIDVVIEIEQINLEYALGFSATDRWPVTEIDNAVIQDSVYPRFR